MPAALATPLRHCARRYASSSVSAEEVAYFSARAASWWDASGEFGLLHRMNAARFSFLRDTLQREQTSELPPLFLKGRSLLDVGCGGGLFAEGAARLGAKTLGIDASEPNVQAARHHAQQDPGLAALSYRAVAAETLAEEVVQYDVVCSLDVLEHVNDPRFFLTTLDRLLKPGGHLLISTISRTMLARFLTISVAESPWVGFVSKGTHQFDKYIRPDELARFLHADLGWDTSNFEVCGVNYIPLLGVWRRGRSTRGTDALGRPKVDQQANFFLSARKPHRP